MFDIATSAVTFTGRSGLSPFWSPDGSQIVFTTGPGIHRMEADGSGVVPVYSGPGIASRPSLVPVHAESHSMLLSTVALACI
ncbi:MAG: PD40 domain-containing protein [Gemmatimonadetes bacterium]|nr:PD40 domain-containing protein [Gemmatimonadota bacterium]